MSIIFRADKSEALTYSEMDENFGSCFYSSSVIDNGATLLLHYASSINVPIQNPVHEIPLYNVDDAPPLSVLFRSGSQITGAAGFMYNPAASRVGINTVTPTASLHGIGEQYWDGPVEFTDTLTVGGAVEFQQAVVSKTSFTSEGSTLLLGDVVVSGSFSTSGSNTGFGVEIPQAKLDGSGSFLWKGSSIGFTGPVEITGSLKVTGTVTAQEFRTELVNSSIVYQSGSTKFGDSANDTHQITGSVNISGSYNLVGNSIRTGNEVVTGGITRVGNTILTGSIGLQGTATVTQLRLSDLNTAPTTSGATGTKGEIRLTSTGLYICTATNTWIRALATTW